MDYRKKPIVVRLNLCVNDILITFFKVGCCSVIINKSTNLQLPVQSVSITTEVVSSNPVHNKVYSIQHYVIKFVSGQWFSPGTLNSSTNRIDPHDITEILMKVALNTPNTLLNFTLFFL